MIATRLEMIFSVLPIFTQFIGNQETSTINKILKMKCSRIDSDFFPILKPEILTMVTPFRCVCLKYLQVKFPLESKAFSDNQDLYKF